MQSPYVHSHYSPFQFSSATQMAQEHSKVIKEKKHYKAAHLEAKRRTHDMRSTMPLVIAHDTCSLPNAFISPNQPDVMRQAKAVFGEF